MNDQLRRRQGNELATFRNVFDRLLDETGGWRATSETRLPLDITASEDAIIVEAALPGVSPENVDITVHQDTLTIAVREESEEETADEERIYREVRRSRGSRTITLPSGLDIDQADATFENGMLRVVLPRGEEARPRQIQIGQSRQAERGR